MEDQPVSNGVPSSADVDFSEAFHDSSVLFNYTLDQDGGVSKLVLNSHQSRNVISKTVKREFESVKDRREKLVKSFHQAALEDELENWEPPDSLHLSQNDLTWVMDLYGELLELGSESLIKRRLTEEERKFKNGHHTLFRRSDHWIQEVCNHGRDPRLIMQLRPIIDNETDRTIICDAAAWSFNDGSGSFLTSDRDHMLDNRERIADEINRNRNSDTVHMMDPREFLDLDPDY